MRLGAGGCHAASKLLTKLAFGDAHRLGQGRDVRTPLLGASFRQPMVLSFSGRNTGRRYSIPLSAYQIDNQPSCPRRGTFTCRRHVAADDSLWQVVNDRMGELMGLERTVGARWCRENPLASSVCRA